MTKWRGLTWVLMLGASLAGTACADSLLLADDEIAAALSHGPWPAAAPPDPSNRMSGNKNAVALGGQLFSSTLLSSDGAMSCATCHVPDQSFTERKARAEGKKTLDRNTQALLNNRHNRWFGWAGQNDSLWAQSMDPIVHPLELDRTKEQVTDILQTDAFRQPYSELFGDPATIDSEQNLVNVGKLLAAYIETIETGPSPFDRFRDALEAGDAAGISAYPQAAQRGFKIFAGKGNCIFCHSGPLFSNGEFHDAGVPYFVEAGRVDSGRHGGIKALKASPYTLAGSYSDDPDQTGAWKVNRVRSQHADFGTFRVPSLRNVAETGPYMHDGSLETLKNVVEHYSEIDMERLHTDGEAILSPLNLSPEEINDLVAFLESLSGPVTAQ